MCARSFKEMESDGKDAGDYDGEDDGDDDGEDDGDNLAGGIGSIGAAQNS